MATSATNELGKHPSKKVIMELLENQQQNEACSGLMENFSKLRRNSATTETNNLIDNTNEMKNFFHQDDKEITWIIDKHHNWQHSLGKASREISTKITPTKRLMD